MASLGQSLREAREQRGLSLAQVEESTKIKQSYLVALEAEDYAKLPHPTYVKGFIKTYAGFLGLEAQELISLYPHRNLQPAIIPVAKLEKPRLGPGFWLPVVVLLLVVIGLVAYRYGSSLVLTATQTGIPAPVVVQEEVQPTIPPVSAATLSPWGAPAGQALAPPTATPSPAPQRVEVRAQVVASAWISVTVDTVPVFSGTLQPGQERTWVGEQNIYMTVGNAGGLTIFHNGQEKGTLGRNGQVVNVRWTKDSMSFENPASR